LNSGTSRSPTFSLRMNRFPKFDYGRSIPLDTPLRLVDGDVDDMVIESISADAYFGVTTNINGIDAFIDEPSVIIHNLDPVTDIVPDVVVALQSVGVDIPPFGRVDRPHMMTRYLPLREYSCVVDGQFIIDWDLPVLGINDIMPSQLSNLQFNGTDGIIHGVGQSSLAVSGWRPKYDGVEGVQFVATLQNGVKIGFLWYSDKIIRVEAEYSAHYEVLDFDSDKPEFILLSGTPSPNLIVTNNHWRPMSRKLIEDSNPEDIVLLANAQEYRVKQENTFNLYSTSPPQDESGSTYEVSDTPEMMSPIIEVTYVSPGHAKYFRDREDRVRADTRTQVEQAIRAVQYKTFIEYVPYDTQEVAPPVVFAKPQSSEPHVHRLQHQSRKIIGPMSWTKTETKPNLDYTGSLVAHICAITGSVDIATLQSVARLKDSYINGPHVTKLKSSSVSLMVIRSKPPDVFSYANRPMVRTSLVLVLSESRLGPVIRERLKLYVQHGRYVLYVVRPGPYELLEPTYAFRNRLVRFAQSKII